MQVQQLERSQATRPEILSNESATEVEVLFKNILICTEEEIFKQM